jgi:DNA-binding transcriptional MerR regulator
MTAKRKSPARAKAARTPSRKPRSTPARAKTARTPSRKPRPTPALDLRRTAPAKSEGQGDKLYYRIGEVAKLTGIKPYVLRYWESEFRWMAPQKSRSKQRLYRRKDIDTILLVKKLLYDERYTIAGARKLLREMGVGKATESVEVKTLDHRAEYKRIKDELTAIRAAL